MKRTLGGDRINSGNNMEVEMRGYGRSTFNLNKKHKTTMAAGTLVPLWVQIGLPKDDWEIQLGIDVMTKPTLGPLFGSFSVEMHVYQIPIRLYNSWLHNNKIGVGNRMQDVKLPIIGWAAKQPDWTTNMDNQQTNPSSLMAYLGNRGIGVDRNVTPNTIVTSNMMAVPLLGYWEIYKQYYSNKQEGIGGYIHRDPNIIKTITAASAKPRTGVEVQLHQWPADDNIELGRDSYVQMTYTGTTPDPEQIVLIVNGERIAATKVFQNVQHITGVILFKSLNRTYDQDQLDAWDYIGENELQDSPPVVVTFPLENIDKIREELLATTGAQPYAISATSIAPYGPPINWNGAADTIPPLLTAQEGLGVISYKSDKLNNWLDTEAITGENGINAITAVDTSGGSFEIEALILAKKVYVMMNRVQLSGGTYKDWMEVNWVTELNGLAETPIYEGGLMKELMFQEVVSNAESEGQPLGTLAGRGRLTDKHKGGHVKIHAREHCVLMALGSITPRLDYTQGNAWWTQLKTMDDFHKPALDGIGFQDLLTEEMAWWDNNWTTGNVTRFSAGKQPAWTNYKTDINIATGNFAIENSEMWMVLARRYEQDVVEKGKIKDVTTLIDPVKFNNIFAEVARDAMNFWVQADINATVRRTMSSEDLPNL